MKTPLVPIGLKVFLPSDGRLSYPDMRRSSHVLEGVKTPETSKAPETSPDSFLGLSTRGLGMTHSVAAEVYNSPSQEGTWVFLCKPKLY